MADTELMQLEKIRSDTGLNPAQQTRYDFLSSQAGSGGGLGSYDALLKGLPSATDFAKSLSANENDIFSDYFKIAQSQPKPLDLYTKMEESAGIPQLKSTQSTIQGQIYDLEDSLRRIEPDISARSRNSIVTDAQRRGMVTEAQKPLIENLGWLGQSLGRVSSAIASEKQDIGTKVGYAMEGFKQELEPYKMKLTMTIDQNSRLMTGFTADRQTQLDVLLAKIQREEELNDREWEMAMDLSKQERQFENQKALMKEEYNMPDNKIVDSNGRQLLVNMRDGKVIADLGSSKSGGTGTSGIFTLPTAPSSPKPTTAPPNNPYGINNQLYNILYGR